MSQLAQKRGMSFFSVILCGIVSCLLGVYFATVLDPDNKTVAKPAYEYSGAVLSHPRMLSEFSLQGSDDKVIDNARLQGKWTLAFFGFTNCAMMCPTAMHELAQTYGLLEADKVKNLPQVLMVSVDPERDTISKIKDYVTGFNQNFIGATGSDHTIRALSLEMGVAYEKVADRQKGSEQSYDIQHSGAVIVLNPKGEIQAFFNWPHKPKDMAEDYKHLINQ